MGKPSPLSKIEDFVSRETLARLMEFADLALKWDETHNLFAKSAANGFWHRHILDCLQLLPLIPPTASSGLDIGSGGGLPGIVLAIARPKSLFMNLVEPNRKKNAFLSAVIGRMSLNAKAYSVRVEDLKPSEIQADIVTARAVSSLDSLLKSASPWLQKGAVGLFQKGQDYRRELETAGHHWHFGMIRHQSAIAADSVILEISNLKPAMEKHSKN